MKRYDIETTGTVRFVETEAGHWVRYEEAARLIQEISAARMKIRQLASRIVDGWHEEEP